MAQRPPTARRSSPLVAGGSDSALTLSYPGQPSTPGPSRQTTLPPPAPPTRLPSPVVLVEFVLPLELPAAHHTVVPQHQAPRHPLMELSGQVPEEMGHVPHRGQLEREAEQTLGEAQPCLS